MDKPNDIFYKVEIRYESEGVWLDENLYIIQKPVWVYRDEGDVYHEHDHHFWISDKDGENAYVADGNLYYMQAMSNAILLKSAETEHYKVSVSEIDWTELPQTHQKKFDNYSPIKFHEYPDSKYIQVKRAKVPDGISAERWLYNHNQPFDIVIIWTDNEDEQMLGCASEKRDDGMYLKDWYTACPIGGSREVSLASFNNSCSEHLAGSAGYDYTCKKCGYTYRSVEMMS